MCGVCVAYVWNYLVIVVYEKCMRRHDGGAGGTNIATWTPGTNMATTTTTTSGTTATTTNVATVGTTDGTTTTEIQRLRMLVNDSGEQAYQDRRYYEREIEDMRSALRSINRYLDRQGGTL